MFVYFLKFRLLVFYVITSLTSLVSTFSPTWNNEISPSLILALHVGLLAFCFFSSQCSYQETFLFPNWLYQQDQQVEKLLFLNFQKVIQNPKFYGWQLPMRNFQIFTCFGYFNFLLQKVMLHKKKPLVHVSF